MFEKRPSPEYIDRLLSELETIDNERFTLEGEIEEREDELNSLKYDLQVKVERKDEIRQELCDYGYCV